MKPKTLLALGSIVLLLSSCYHADWRCSCWTRPGLPDSVNRRYDLGTISGTKAADQCRSHINERDTCALTGYK